MREELPVMGRRHAGGRKGEKKRASECLMDAGEGWMGGG